jgi:hypothetical protein
LANRRLAEGLRVAIDTLFDTLFDTLTGL